MASTSHLSLTTLTKSEIREANVFSGISPKAMQRVFYAWLAFVAVVSGLVMFAPALSLTFILITLSCLVVFTLAMFAQSRLFEGWPAVLANQEHLLMVRDPYKRQFFCVPRELISAVEPTVIKPNKKAIAVVLQTAALNDQDRTILEQAVWPREDRLLALAHYVSRDRAVSQIRQFVGLDTQDVEKTVQNQQKSAN